MEGDATMTRPHEHWEVMPHGRLAPIDDGILAVEGRIRMPLGDLPRRMTVVRLRDSRLVVWSAITLDDAAMATLEAFGRPGFLVVPNSWLLRPREHAKGSPMSSPSIRRRPISAMPM